MCILGLVTWSMSSARGRTGPGDTISLPDSIPAVQAAPSDLQVDAQLTGAAHDASDTALAVMAGAEEPAIPAVRGNALARTVARLGITRFARGVYRFRFHLLVLIVSIAIIVAAFMMLFSSREKKRFLTTTRLSIMDKQVQRVCRYIEKNFADSGMTVDSICEILVTGKAFVEALFERELGMRVEDFIEQVRINHAIRMLEKEPSLRPDAIAFRTGYTTADLFCVAFRNVRGLPFESYQRKLAQAEEEMP